MKYPVVLAQGVRLNDANEITNFESIRVYESSFPREMGDKIRYEGESWTVIGRASSREQVIQIKNNIVSDFRKAGHRYSSRRAKF